jgi:hypothetical protein
MGIKYFVKAAVSEYESEGKMKKRYQSIGIVMETKHGLMLKLESLPIFAMKEGFILAYLNEPEDKVEQPKASPNLSTLEDDPPF